MVVIFETFSNEFLFKMHMLFLLQFSMQIIRKKSVDNNSTLKNLN